MSARAGGGRVARRVAWLGAVGLAGAGCHRSESSSGGGAPAPSGVAASAASSSAPSASAAVTAVPVVPAEAAFEGTYAAAPGTLYLLPDEPSWRGDDAGDGLGPGTLALRVDRATGRVTGKGDGALGAVVLVGQLGDEGVLTFAMRPADPMGGGFTGTGYATREDGGFTGTLHASNGRANLLREATFTMSAK